MKPIAKLKMILPMTVAAFTLAMFLSACKSDGNAKEEDSPLLFAVGGVPAELAIWEEIASEYTAETHENVSLLRQPADSDQRRQSLAIALQAQQSEPDVFLMDVAWVAQFAASKWLSPLKGDSLPLDSSFPQGAIAAGNYQGTRYALPVYIDGGLLYYRRDLLEKYGFVTPPQTWDALRLMAEKVQAGERSQRSDFFGYVWQGAQYEGLVCHFLEVATSAGGGLPIQDAHLSIASLANEKALETMQGWLGKARISPPETYTSMKEEEVRNAFEKGNALFERNWPYAWALHQAEKSPVRGKVGLAPLPHFDGNASAATLGGWHIDISAFSKRQRRAEKFLRYVLSLTVQKSLALRLGWNPSRTEVYSDTTVLDSLPHFKALGEVFANAIARPPLPYWTSISEVLQKHLNAALTGKGSAKAALHAAQSEADAIVARYGGLAAFQKDSTKAHVDKE